jgi:hypothetical protein
MRANAMSDAPICSGIIQFAKPTKAGMIAPNTMIRPCIVVNWLNSSGRKNCRPGSNSSADQQRQHAARQQHGEREQQVQRADVLVVGGEQPAAPAVRMIVAHDRDRARGRADGPVSPG